MTHIVPMLCLILFIGFIEYRLNKHLKEVEKEIQILEQLWYNQDKRIKKLENG